MENLIEMDDLGGKPTIFGNTQIQIQDAKVRMLTSSCFEVEKTTKVSAALTFRWSWRVPPPKTSATPRGIK